MKSTLSSTGTVGAMGAGAPAWKELLKLPDRESVQSKVTG